MQDSHLAEWTMDRDTVDGKRVFPCDITEEFRVRRPTDRRLVEFHLDTANAGKVPGVYMPFGTLAVALEKITASCPSDQVPQSIGRDEGTDPIPFNFRQGSVSKRCMEDPDLCTIQCYVCLEQVRRYRLNGSYLAAHSCGTETEGPDIGADIEHPVISPDVLHPVLGNFSHLAEPGGELYKPDPVPGGQE